MLNHYLEEVDDLILKLNEDQLRIINNKIVERLKLMYRAKSTMSLSRFNLGDRVYFLNNGVKEIGKIVKLNQKTATVILDSGRQWLVAPNLLVKIIER